mgnify:CR=1 FL=1
MMRPLPLSLQSGTRQEAKCLQDFQEEGKLKQTCISKIRFYMISIFTVLTMIMIPISWIYVKRIDYMKNNYPNYKGEDLFDENDGNS